VRRPPGWTQPMPRAALLRPESLSTPPSGQSPQVPRRPRPPASPPTSEATGAAVALDQNPAPSGAKRAIASAVARLRFHPLARLRRLLSAQFLRAPQHHPAGGQEIGAQQPRSTPTSAAEPEYNPARQTPAM
jgi:hypothetical protein